MSSRDIDQALVLFSRFHPQVKLWQLAVSHPADDDGIWFFRFNEIEVQAESSTGNCPFLIESNLHSKKIFVTDLKQLVSVIEVELGIAKAV